VSGTRLRTLLILLALDAGRPVTAIRLVDGVWGDEPPAAAGNALQALVSRLRRTVPDLVLESAPAGYRLTLDRDRVDAHRFARLAEAGRDRLADDPAGAAAELREALRLWRGAALADVAFPDAVRDTVARLEELRLTAVRDRIDADLRLGAGAELVPELEGLVEAYPLHEPLAALLMRALMAAGSPGRALAVYDRTRRRLADALGTDPSPELAGLHLAALRGTPAGPVRGNLPAEMSSFVGRDADVVAVTDLIGRHRLVTLTGPGGSGKTRLSVEIGPRLNGTAPDGVWRVELAPVTDPAEVPQAILGALRLRGQALLARASRRGRLEPVAEAVDPLTRLGEAIAGKTMVLILDNCEHLIGTAAQVADGLLRAAPGLRLLATSREPLGIPGEQLWPVEPLSLPPVDADPGTAAAYPAVRLLLDRAAAARPGYAPQPDTIGAVVRICRALDGMPLAIELAAARLRTLPIEVLADRLADRFRLLTGGSRTALPRHQTLRAVVDWSWDLLDDRERALCRRLSVFAGGADVRGAEEVCAGGPVHADDVVDVLGALVDKSLVVLSGTRYRMLETIREYGRDRLTEAGEVEQLRRAHAGYMLDLAGAAEPHLRGADQLSWLRRLVEEHDNLHAALRAAIGAGDTPNAVALVARLGWYWWLRGHRVEGMSLAAEALAMPGDAPAEDRALTYAFAALNGLEGAATMNDVQAWFQAAEALGAGRDAEHPALRLLGPLSSVFATNGEMPPFDLVTPLFDDPDPWLRAGARMIVAHLRLNFGQSADLAEAELRASLAGFRAIGERWGIGFTLSALADLAAARGDFAQAVNWQREAIALVREVGIREDLPQLEIKLAHQLWMLGERAEARRVLELARASAEDVGMPEVMASIEYGDAMIARAEGRLDDARVRIDRAATLVDSAARGPQFRAVIRSTQALVRSADGDLDTARALHVEAVETAVLSQDFPVVALTLVGAADFALRCGDPHRAARLLGAATAVRGGPDFSLPDAARVEQAVRTALGDAAFDRAYQAGGSVTAATAVEAAGLGPAAVPGRTA
jgi:predicted ATPase/DNA-binding SARP family transcriptional activator